MNIFTGGVENCTVDEKYNNVTQIIFFQFPQRVMRVMRIWTMMRRKSTIFRIIHPSIDLTHRLWKKEETKAMMFLIPPILKLTRKSAWALKFQNQTKKNKDFVSIIIYYLSPVTRTYFHWEHVTCRTPEETSRLLFSLEFDVKRLLSDVALILSNQRRMMPPNSTARNPMSL